ncbi:hypothetical protein V8E53_014420 [Lactarius tabidus]
MQKKQKRESADEGPSRPPAIPSENSHLDEGSNTNQKDETNVPIKFKDENAMMTQLKKSFKRSDCIFFYACYDSPEDPLMSDEDLVSTTAHKIWKVTGYRFW